MEQQGSQKRPIFKEFAETIQRRRQDSEQVLRRSAADLDADLRQLLALREELNLPHSDESVTGFVEESGEIGQDVLEELSGKRIPELQGLLAAFANGLTAHAGVARRCQVGPELLRETIDQDINMGRIIYNLDRLYRGARDAWMVYCGAAIGLCQRTLSAIRAQPRRLDLSSVLAGLLPEEITPDDLAGKVRTLLHHLTETFLANFHDQNGGPG